MKKIKQYQYWWVCRQLDKYNRMDNLMQSKAFWSKVSLLISFFVSMVLLLVSQIVSKIALTHALWIFDVNVANGLAKISYLIYPLLPIAFTLILMGLLNKVDGVFADQTVLIKRLKEKKQPLEERVLLQLVHDQKSKKIDFL